MIDFQYPQQLALYCPAYFFMCIFFCPDCCIIGLNSIVPPKYQLNECSVVAFYFLCIQRQSINKHSIPLIKNNISTVLVRRLKKNIYDVIVLNYKGKQQSYYMLQGHTQ